jgi:hypothetical protein
MARRPRPRVGGRILAQSLAQKKRRLGGLSRAEPDVIALSDDVGIARVQVSLQGSFGRVAPRVSSDA